MSRSFAWISAVALTWACSVLSVDAQPLQSSETLHKSHKFLHRADLLQLHTDVHSGSRGSLRPMKCPGSDALLGHAKTGVFAVASASCADVKAEIIARAQGSTSGAWDDPHNGGKYTVLSSNSTNSPPTLFNGHGGYIVLSSNTDVETQRTTNPTYSYGGTLYTDRQSFVLSEDNGKCTIEACSESQGNSEKDFSTNYCNIRNLYCSSTDKCQPMVSDFATEEIKVDATSGQSDFSKCIVTEHG